MRIVHMSDTHGNTVTPCEIPTGEFFVHSGDFTRFGKEQEVREFAAFVGRLSHKHKIVVAGNHDAACEGDYRWTAQAFRTQGVHYLQDSSVELEGVKFWGSPYTPVFRDWFFMVERGGPAKKKWSVIPEDTDVLVTHGPPYMKLDRGRSVLPLGCEELAKAVERVKPRLHLFGHVHPTRGVVEDEYTVYVNSAACDGLNYLVEDPHVIEYDIVQGVLQVD